MRLTTSVEIQTPPFTFGYQSPIMLLGSCFASNMGEQLQRLKFPTLLNPFGVLYNPASIAQAIELMLGSKQFEESDLHYQNGVWCSYHHHSSFASTDKLDTLQRINQQLQQSNTYLQQLDTLIITLGTAWVYTLNQTGQVVANCHKTPASELTRRMLSIDEAASCLQAALAKLKNIRPQLKVLFTVSPIRHFKDGAHANQLSKATLLLAIQQLQEQQENTYYFPAYELMMDELRDYRFYADDMLHPSALAVKYIWNKFHTTMLDEESKSILPELEKIIQAKEHRVFNPNTDEHKKFLQAFKHKTEQLLTRYPYLNLTEELSYFSNF